MVTNQDDVDVAERTAERVALVAAALGEELTGLARAMHEEMSEKIPELNADPIMLDLLRASTESNVETFLHVAQHGIPLEDVFAPSAAVEYARRLAQRGISAKALLRAYRVGQQAVMERSFLEIAREEPDGAVAFAAAMALQQATFAYVDRVSEQVVDVYEVERERWLANRNLVRASTLTAVLRGDDVEMSRAEQSLGYRLRQHHLGLVAWTTDPESSTTELRHLEGLVSDIGQAVGAAGQPLFVPQDDALAWAWIPLGRQAKEVDLDRVTQAVAAAGGVFRVALGAPEAAGPGFRRTHVGAVRAHAVATAAGVRSQPATSYQDDGVRAAAVLARDLDLARDLVADALGGLAVDDEGVERLRETLLTFLTEKGSYLATAERVHLHKNTVKYRVDKAIEARGRAIDDDRLNLELGLIACRWLGTSVLRRA